MAKHDIFICFSSKDESAARQVVASLEAGGFKCWISLRDVEPGQNYQESIVRAIETSKIIVFLFSENSSKSGEIRKELSLGASGSVTVIPLRLSAVMPSGALRYELATRQWIDAFPDPEQAFGKLLAAVKDTLERPDGGAGLDEHAGSPFGSRETRPPSIAAERAPIVPPGSEQFEAVRSLLARHIGPIAKILVQKAATEARSLDDFCDRLAAHLQTPSDRAAFLQAVRARLAVKS